MKKFLYIMPAVLICMLYMLLVALAGGFTGLQPVALVYICFPLAAGILLRRDKWWGSLLGMTMGGILLYNGRNLMAAFVIGLVLIGYYGAMGLLCALVQKEK